MTDTDDSTRIEPERVEPTRWEEVEWLSQTEPVFFSDNDRFSAQASQVFVDSLELLLQKHRDYGPENIARAPGGPLMGLAVRLHDKVARLAHLLENGATPENESLADTFLDITNYGAIGQMVLGGTWPGVPGTKSAGVEK